MTQEEIDLCLGIAKDPAVREAYTQALDDLKNGTARLPTNPYYAIARSQAELMVRAGYHAADDMHLPEPWNGHLSSARILFVGSNPSINPHEIGFPTIRRSDDYICRYFDSRLDSGCDLKARYWTGIRKYTNWILPHLGIRDEIFTNVEIGRYAVCTEVVHCKSTSEVGVAECLRAQAGYFKGILRIFKGDVVAVLGGKARAIAGGLFPVGSMGPKVIYLDHPSSYMKTDARKRQDVADAFA